MSGYIKNAKGKIESNSINEVNTSYDISSNDTTESVRELNTNQNTYSEEPISQVDTEYNNDYRTTIERLRTQTESMCMALESALVPRVVQGSCVQILGEYVYRDQLIHIRTEDFTQHKEYVYKTNIVQFKSDRHKRLCYNRTIHVFSKTGDSYTTIATKYGVSAASIKNATDPYGTESLTDALDEGIDIDTTVVATVRNLYQYGYIEAFLGFLNGQILPWEVMTIATDEVDTYIIIDIGNKQASNSWYDLPETCDFTYVSIPFKVSYFSGVSGTVPEGYEGKTPIFAFSDPYATIHFNSDTGNPGYFKIYCDDPNIIFEEFEMDNEAYNSITTSKLGILFNKRLSNFDYRHKIKWFNMLCVERQADGYKTLLKQDFDVDSHQFNILKITIDKILNAKRVFKVFYDKRVVYDQDNMLRIKNRSYLANQFEAYMKDVNSSVKTFIDEIYNLKQRDTDNVLGITLERVAFNNMEEGSTPSDEFIYYTNTEAKNILKELALQIFEDDSETVKNVMYDLIDRAYINNYNASNPKNEWFLRLNLPEMFVYDVSEDYEIDDMSLLDEVFDFTYNDQLSYRENLTNAADYIIGYDADKLEASIIRSVVSKTMMGSELTSLINTNRLYMPRWNVNANYNFVMIFRNGELYQKYNTIQYTDIEFNVEMIPDTDFYSTDKFEFVFFLNANNNITPIDYQTLTQIPSKFEWDDMDTTTRPGVTETVTNQNAIPCNTTMYDPENIMVLVDRLSDNDYDSRVETSGEYKNTAYPLYYNIKSYKQLKTSTSAVATLQDDEMINGVYRVTKQGGGEYFIYPSSEPDSGQEDPGNVPNPDLGIDELAFANCVSVNEIIFTGTTEQWNAISKDSDWCSGMNIGNINNNGGVTCTDGSVLLN